MLSETGAASIKAMGICLLSDLKRTGQMENNRWPKILFNGVLCKMKKARMQQNIKWMDKWNIHLNKCPTNNKEIKVHY